MLQHTAINYECNEIMAAQHHDADDGSLELRANHADDVDKAAIAKVNCSNTHNTRRQLKDKLNGNVL